MQGHTEIVKALLAAGANLNAANNDGYTALHSAALSTRARGFLQPIAPPHAAPALRESWGTDSAALGSCSLVFGLT